jgi:hypothetical protein
LPRAAPNWDELLGMFLTTVSGLTFWICPWLTCWVRGISTSRNPSWIHAIWSPLSHTKRHTHPAVGGAVASLPGELGNAFGLPVCLSLGGLEEGMFPFIPVQVLMGCLDSLIQSNLPVLQLLSTPARRILAPVPTSTWLPNIQKRLDHAWIDQTAVSAKAAKSDTSRVPTHLWDQQILLPLPGVHGGLPFLRSRLMRFQRSRLYTEFRTYMAATHGADWSGQLMALWAEMRTRIQELRQRGGPNGQHRGNFEDKGKTKGAGAKRDRNLFKGCPTKKGRGRSRNDSKKRTTMGLRPLACPTSSQQLTC